MLSQFNLKIEGNNLLYEHKLRFGSVDFPILEMDEEGIQKIIEFLELPYIPWGDTAEDLFYAVVNSPYFNKHIFLDYISLNKEYIEFKELIKKENPITVYRPAYTPGYRAYLVDKFFGTKIVKRLEELKNIGYSRRTLRNKLNGHLIQKWVPELKPGRIVSDCMKEFKEHIERRFNTNFLEYIKERPNKLVRLDFMYYYYDDFDFFVTDFEDELPF